MRLSEAIREGAKSRRQIRGMGSDGREGSCALGAASYAGMSLAQAGPILALPTECPSCDSTAENYYTIGLVVIHLNDSHRWTFEQIADWVQAQEAIHGIGQDEEGNGTHGVKAQELVGA